jgi:hypothetical protein
MDITPELARTEVAPSDLLIGAGAIRANNANTCSLNRPWTDPATYLEWARRGFQAADEHGLTNAITYAKRAACCRIDRLVNNSHLRCLHRARFPVKIQALTDIGMVIPSVIQELIINPRNELEHDYIRADADTARRALDIATLFLSATDSFDSREAIIALNMNMLYSDRGSGGEEHVTFDGWSGSGGPMLFVDIFAKPHTAKIVDGNNREVRYVQLAKFTRQEAAQLATILQGHYSLGTRNSGGASRFFYTEIKRLAGF